MDRRSVGRQTTRFGGEIACNALAVMFRASVAELRSSAPRTSNELRSHRNFFFLGGGLRVPEVKRCAMKYLMYQVSDQTSKSLTRGYF